MKILRTEMDRNRKKQYPALAAQINDTRIVLVNWMQSLPIMWLFGVEGEKLEKKIFPRCENKKSADCVNFHS